MGPRQTSRPRIIPARAGFTPRVSGGVDTRSDHPRSRGVYPLLLPRPARGRGSSPLARGLPSVNGAQDCAWGIIPARAGFTAHRRRRRLRRADHPRSRGVYPRSRRALVPSTGSSPLARGLLRGFRPGGEPERIIPARAGFTGHLSEPPSSEGDHPRSRGVYTREMTVVDRRTGSSPLARGLRREVGGAVGDGGIIPARAGFTATPSSRWPPRRDHPRSRGVYRRDANENRPPAGSSPLARGLPPTPTATAPGTGIIPARAGFTPEPSPMAARSQDHPRSRGVYDGSACIEAFQRGSSPLARGLRVLARPHGPTPGIIPARAGFTAAGPIRRMDGEDHPRSRGVYQSYAVSWTGAPGSSPLARGLRRPGRRAPRHLGIIPARAGFTSEIVGVHCGFPDHPRSRGVYARARDSTHRERGSSPLARGLRFMIGSSQSVFPDHPRSRGVYWMDSSPVAPSPGSSPLARGLPRRAYIYASCVGIIPARAGFTAPRGMGRRIGGDHPRSRGVYATRETTWGSVRGSSPLARGLLMGSHMVSV